MSSTSVVADTAGIVGGAIGLTALPLGKAEDQNRGCDEEQHGLATNYRDIGYIEFGKDALDAKVNELFKELIAFNLVKVTVGG